jgi:hypothetical protein
LCFLHNQRAFGGLLREYMGDFCPTSAPL